jgi:hypothetical protein
MGLVLLRVAAAYLLAGIPVGAFALLGRMSPVYSYSRNKLIVYWSWFALIIAASSVLYAIVS